MDSAHFKTAMAALPDMLTTTPQIITAQTELDGWSPPEGPPCA